MSKNVTTTYYVDGMHCAACETLIEKSIGNMDGVSDVSASTAKGEVQVTHSKDKEVSIQDANHALEKHGYTLSTEKSSKLSDVTFISFSNGKLEWHPEVFNNLLPALLIVTLIMIGFFWLSESGIAASVMVTEEAGWTVFFLFGLVAGASTCAALVGGLLLSLSKKWNESFGDNTNTIRSLLPHGMFYIGRLLGFALIGGALAVLGSSIQSGIQTASPFIAFVIGIVMVILGLQMLKVRWAKNVSLSLPKQLQFSSTSNDSQTKLHGPLLTGMGSILLPCGMTITAFIMVISADSILNGVINMLAFGFGTAVSLSLISIASVGAAFKEKYANTFYQVAGLLVLFFGLYTVNAQLVVFGAPNAGDIAGALLKTNSTTTVAVDSDTEQIIKMEASAFGYSPTNFTLKAGVPVRWEINNTGASGCTNAIMARGLIDGTVALDPGLTVVEFTPQKKGNYKFSCWMGMVGGTIKVI